MKTVKPDAPPPSALERIGAGFFWVLVSGTLAAKVLLLVDTDLDYVRDDDFLVYTLNVPTP